MELLLNLLVIVFWFYVIRMVMQKMRSRADSAEPLAKRPAIKDGEPLRRAAPGAVLATPKLPKAPRWLKQFAIDPAHVSKLVVLEVEADRLSLVSSSARELSLRCYEEGRCRGGQFARFIAGEVIDGGERLVFAHVDEDGWYAFFAPRQLVETAGVEWSSEPDKKALGAA